MLRASVYAIIALSFTCMSVQTQPLREPAALRGEVANITVNADGSARVELSHVTWFQREGQSQPRESDRIILWIGRIPGTENAKTRLFEQRDDLLRETSLAYLVQHQSLRVWITEEALRSLPPQYFARQLVITPLR